MTQLNDLSESTRALRSGQLLILRLMPRILALPHRSATRIPLRKGGNNAEDGYLAPHRVQARKLIRFDLGAERGLVYPNLLSVLPSIRTIQQPNLHFTQNRRLEITCIHARV